MTGNHKRAIQCCCILLCGMLLSGCNSVHWGREYTCDAPAEPGALTSPSEGNWLRVVSWNLHGTPEVAPMQRRLERVAAQVLARKPDIALFQEVWFEGDAILLERALSFLAVHRVSRRRLARVCFQRKSVGSQGRLAIREVQGFRAVASIQRTRRNCEQGGAAFPARQRGPERCHPQHASSGAVPDVRARFGLSRNQGGANCTAPPAGRTSQRQCNTRRRCGRLEHHAGRD